MDFSGLDSALCPELVITPAGRCRRPQQSKSLQEHQLGLSFQEQHVKPSIAASLNNASSWEEDFCDRKQE